MKIAKGVLMLTVLLVLAVSSHAFANTSVVGTAGNAWQTWVTGDLNENGQPYWDGASADGTGQGIGYYLANQGAFLGGSGPGVLPYWGNSSTANGYDPNFYFNTNDAGQVATMKIEIAGYKDFNVFGWYELTSGTQHLIFNGPAGAGAAMSFNPTSDYGFYLTSKNGDTYYTQSSKNTDSSVTNAPWQHFALFQEGSSYWLGMEDLRECNSDKDYNDMIVKVTPIVTPVPVPAALWLFGTGLLGLVGIRRRMRG